MGKTVHDPMYLKSRTCDTKPYTQNPALSKLYSMLQVM